MAYFYTTVLDCTAPLNHAYSVCVYTGCDVLRVREGSVTALPNLREAGTLKLATAQPTLGTTHLVVAENFVVDELSELCGEGTVFLHCGEEHVWALRNVDNKLVKEKNEHV